MNKYYSTFKIHVLEAFQYKVDLIAIGIMALIYSFALYNLWNTVYTQYQIVGFTLAGMVWYVALAQVIRTCGGRPVKEISESIQNGTIVNYMNKPVNYIWYMATTQLGKHILSFVSSLIICGLFVFSLFGFPNLNLLTLTLVFVTIFLGILINFLLGFILATTAFWIEDANPISWIYDKIIFILGGFLFPIDILPTFFLNIAKYLPISYFIYYPTKLFINFNYKLLLETLIGQGIYIIIFIIMAKYLLYKGTKKLSINGG
jgi:ABC-2 type transport system permease protein